MTGETISHYLILAKLGEGAMGVVYKAEDTKLRRTVALKFLPRDDDELRRRLLTEAQAAASLHHPNICTVFEIDEELGFLAMEFVDGPTLKDRIAERPLKLAEALDIASQTAEGLRAAHEKGVVHRDIKPANVMLTQQGVVKIMDFGLALISDRTRLTRSGTSLGTPAYMSPEQARGETADRRADIWSLGVLLYEMISGRVPFAGQSEAAVARAILDDDPEPLTALRTKLPVELDRVINKALAKDPAARYQHVEDLTVDLRRISPAPVRVSHAPTRWFMPAAMLLLGAAISAGWFHFSKPELAVEAPKQNRFEISSGPRFGAPAISPNGRMIAFRNDGKLWIRNLDELKAREVPGSAGAQQPFWSPDSKHIGFKTGANLLKAPAQGGTAVTVAKIPQNVLGAAWGKQGKIVLALFQLGLYSVPEHGGEPTLLVKPNAPSEYDFHGPNFLPDGSILCVTHSASMSSWQIIRIHGQERSEVFKLAGAAESLAYLPTGHIVFNYQLAGPGLQVLPIDPSTFRATGSPFHVEESGQNISVSDDGSLVFLKRDPPKQRVVIMDRQGKELQAVTLEDAVLGTASLSPNGREFVVATPSPATGGDLWIHDLASAGKRRFTFSTANDTSPSWSPKGDLIAYRSDESIAIKPVDGSPERLLVRTSFRGGSQLEWSPDGQRIFYTVFPLGSGSTDIWQAPLDPSKPPRPVIESPALENGPAISPDGRFLAYSSDETGTTEVYVKTYPEGNGKWIVSSNTGRSPRWNPKGSELLFISFRSLMSAKVELTPSFRMLRTDKIIDFPLNLSYEFMPDGQRLMVMKSEESNLASIVFIQNWLATLPRKP